METVFYCPKFHVYRTYSKQFMPSALYTKLPVKKETKLYELFFVHRTGAVRTFTASRAKVLYNSIIVLVEENYHILAMRLLIAETGMDLKEAKSMIDQIK